MCSSYIIIASTKIYVTYSLIDDLVHPIKQFISGQVIETYWSNEEKGDFSTTCISFRFLPKDKLGHIFIEVYMELDDGGDYSNHNCVFYLNTEIGLLERFFERLPKLKQKSSGIKLTLNENE